MYSTERSNFRRFSRSWGMLGLALAATLLAGCGGGGGGGGLPPERTERVISGVGFDGPVIDGSVKIYDFSSGTKDEANLIGQSMTDERGRYSIPLRVGSRPILVEVTGGRYIEEATGKVVNFGETDVLRAVYNFDYDAAAEIQIAVTFYTHLATGLADYLIRKGALAPAEAVDQANARLSEMLGLDIAQVLPADVTDAANRPQDNPDTQDVDESSVLTPSLRYGFMTAAVSQWTEWASRQNGADQPHALYTSLFFAQRAYEDIQWDGELNGQKEDGSISLGQVPVTGDVYRNDLALNMVAMAASLRNASGFGPAGIVEVANSYSNSTIGDGLFGGAPAVPFTDVFPTVAITTPANGKVVAGSFAATATVADRVGVSSVSFFIDGAAAGTASDPAQPSVTIDTRTLADGDHRIKVVATNVFGNSASEESGFKVANKGTTIGNIKPGTGAFVRGKFTMSADVVDPVGIRSVQFKDDAGNVVEAHDAANPTAEMDTQIAGKVLRDGKHDFTVTATNTVGNTLNETVNYSVDNTIPQVTLQGVRDGQFLTGQVRVTGSASDANMEKAQLLVNGQVHTEFTSAFNNLSAQVNTVSVEDGNRPFVLRATDKAGNVAESAALAVVDNTAPVIRIQSPAPNDTVSESFVFAARVSDPTAGVDTVRVTFDGRSQNLKPDATETVTTTFNVRGLSGPQTVTITATDKAGNQTGATTVTVVVDNNAPRVTITGLSNDQVVRGVVNITASASATSGVRLVDFKLDGNVVRTFTTGFGSMSYAMDTGTLAEGEHVFEVFVVGQISNATVKRRFIVDRTSPVINLSSPTAAAWLGKSVTVAGQINEPNVASATVVLAGKSQDLSGDLSNFSAVFDMTGVNGRDQALQVSVTDKAGNSARKDLLVNIDTSAPTVTGLSPPDGTLVVATFRATATVADGAGSGVTGGTFFFAGVAKAATKNGDDWVADFSTEGLLDGQHTIEFEAVDAVGNRSTRIARSVQTDATAPQVTIGSPAPGATIAQGATIQLRATVTDAVSEIAEVALTVNGAAHSLTVNGRNVIADIATAGVLGELTLTLSAADSAGNSSAPVSVKVNVTDQTAPAVAIQEPAANATVERGAQVVLSATATDANGVASVALKVNGADHPVSISGTRVSATIDTAALSGRVTLSLTATDRAGNSTSPAVTRQFNVADSTAPNVAIDQPLTDSIVERGTGVTFLATATDIGGIASVTLRVNGSIHPTTRDGSEVSATIDTSALSGSVTFSLTATDAVGNTSDAVTRAVTVRDTTVPTVDIQQPAPGATVERGATLAFAATATDVSGIDSAVLTVNGINRTVVIDGNGMSAAIDTVQLQSPVTLVLIVTDKAGNAAPAVTREIALVDTTAPTVNITGPATTVERGEMVTFTATATDISGIASAALTVNDVVQVPTLSGNAISATLDTTQLASPVRLSLTVTDNADNVSPEATREITLIDTTPPTVSAISGVPPGFVAMGSLTASASASDVSSIARAVFTLESPGLGSISQEVTAGFEAMSVTLDTTAVPDGVYTLTLTVTDQAGNATERSITGIPVANPLAAT